MKSSLHCLQLGSDEIDTYDAMCQILSKAEKKISSKGYSTPKGAIVFFDIEHDPQTIVDTIYANFSEIQLIGCSSYGELNTIEGMFDGSIQIAFLFGDEIDIFVRSTSAEEQASLTTACKKLLDIPKPATVSLFLSEIIQSRGVEEILTELKQHLPTDHPIVGGIAADDYDFKNSIQIANRVIQSDGCSMMHLSGDIAFATSASLGWSSKDEMGVATKAEGYIIHEINHKPALDFYLDETGGVSPNIELPLSIFSPEKKQFLYNRASIKQYTVDDRTEKNIRYMGHIPEGSTLKVSFTDKDKLLTSIPASLEDIYSRFPANRTVQLALFFSCASRKVFLSTDAPEEADTIIKSLPYDSPGMGCYTFGEVGRMHDNSDFSFHNNSLIYVLLG